MSTNQIEGLQAIQGFFKKREEKRASNTSTAGKWLSLKDGEKAKIYMASEFDASADGYSENAGLAVVNVEHTAPSDYKTKFICLANDDGEPCYACERKQQGWLNDDKEEKKWGAKVRVYFNVLVEGDDGQYEAKILSQGTGPSSVSDALLELAQENGGIAGWYSLSRKGQKQDTKYTLIQSKGPDLDMDDYEFIDLKTASTRVLTYDEQVAKINELSGGPKSTAAPAVEETTYASAGAADVNPNDLDW